MKRYNILKDCVIESNFYQCGTVYTDTTDTPNKRYITVLLEHGFMKEIREHPKTVWDLKDGDICYAISSDAYYGNPTAEPMVWHDCPRMSCARSIGSVFLTRQDAEKEIARRTAKQILLRDAKGFKPDWKKVEQCKYYIDYDNQAQELWTEVFTFLQTDQIAFASREDAEASIKAHEKEWKIYLGVEE